jgi:hypothetical protein
MISETLNNIFESLVKLQTTVIIYPMELIDFNTSKTELTNILSTKIDTLLEVLTKFSGA